MTRKERLERLRLRLLEWRDQLRHSLNGEVSGSAGGGYGDECDAATSAYSDELETRLASHMSDELTQIQYALAKFKHGRYGICEMTNAPIPIARLEALPFARYTVEAQRLIEVEGYDPSDLPRDNGWARAVEHEARLGDHDLRAHELEIED